MNTKKNYISRKIAIARLVEQQRNDSAREYEKEITIDTDFTYVCEHGTYVENRCLKCGARAPM